MMLVLEKVDGRLMAFPSGDQAESYCELIDVQNDEYEFFDDDGQLYTHVVTKRAGFLFFSTEDFILAPIGTPDIQNALRLIDKARYFNDRGCGLASINELKEHILKRCGTA
jgi:hypothetical protein